MSPQALAIQAMDLTYLMLLILHFPNFNLFSILQQFCWMLTHPTHSFIDQYQHSKRFLVQVMQEVNHSYLKVFQREDNLILERGHQLQQLSKYQKWTWAPRHQMWPSEAERSIQQQIQIQIQKLNINEWVQVIQCFADNKQMKKTTHEQQIQISSFIKDPASLKLLILAGTNIKHTELSTISKCTGLIKLDLSSNNLSEIPLKFTNFVQLKILYLHDNQLTNIQIKGTQLEYVSLFKNLIQSSQYRRSLIQNNPKLLGIDYNIVTSLQRYSSNVSKLPIYSQIKWPIVQISSNLQHQDDYLNLLKAQIFVISNVQKRTMKIETIEKILLTFAQSFRYNNMGISGTNGMIILPSIIKAVNKWKKYVELKRKLRAILAKKGKEQLILTRLQRIRKQRNPSTQDVLQDFLASVRNKMKVRAILQRQSRSYRAFIPAQRILQTDYLGFSPSRDYKANCAKLYFRYSELDTLSKVCLYAKKLFFQEKDYDLCDEFNQLFKESNKKYYIFRKKSYLTNQNSWLMNSIHETYRYVLGQVGINRRHFLYNKKGHKEINIKRIDKKINIQPFKQRIAKNDRKLQYLFQRYDKLIEYEVYNWKILKTILKIIRYINAGNASSIVSTETAYFQTQVILDDKSQINHRVKIHLGLEFFTKRVIAANIIQKFWRKRLVKKKEINIIQTIRKQRATKLLSRWIRNIIFSHRMSSVHTQSYLNSTWRDYQVYFPLQIYMHMPEPTNYLRFNKKLQNKNQFYNILHKGTQTQIVYNNGRKWIKILYPNSKQAKQAQIIFQKYSYRYFQGMHLKLFTNLQINETKMVEKYEKDAEFLYGITMPKVGQTVEDKNIKKTLWIDNNQPYFIWSEVNSLTHFARFEKEKKNNTNVSIFIYNKHKRPLKVSCQFYWAQLDSIYENRKYRPQIKQKSVSMRETPSKPHAKLNNLKDNSFHEGDISLFDLQFGHKNSFRKGRLLMDNSSKMDKSLDRNKSTRKNSLGSKNESLSKNHRTRILPQSMFEKLSETLNIRGK